MYGAWVNSKSDQGKGKPGENMGESHVFVEKSGRIFMEKRNKNETE